MFKTLFGKETTKANVVFALAGALVAVFEATETVKKYRAQQADKELKK
jgi:hypothetical protein